MTEIFLNNTSTTLAENITDEDTEFEVGSWPYNIFENNCRVKIDDEIMILSNTSGTSNENWTVTRGVEGTTAASHTSGATITAILTADGLYSGMLPNGGSTNQILSQGEYGPQWTTPAINFIQGATDHAAIDAGPYQIMFSGAGLPALEISSTSFESTDYAMVNIPAPFTTIGDSMTGTCSIESNNINIGAVATSLGFYAGAASGLQDIAAYTTSVSDPPTQAEVQAIHDKLEDLITALQAVNLIREPI